MNTQNSSLSNDCTITSALEVVRVYLSVEGTHRVVVCCVTSCWHGGHGGVIYTAGISKHHKSELDLLFG